MIAEGLVRGSRAGPSFVSVRMRRDTSSAVRTSIGARNAHATRSEIGGLQCLIVAPIASTLQMTHRATALLRGNETLAKMGLLRGRADARRHSRNRRCVRLHCDLRIQLCVIRCDRAIGCARGLSWLMFMCGVRRARYAALLLAWSRVDFGRKSLALVSLCVTERCGLIHRCR
jgi:hypothetical protein